MWTRRFGCIERAAAALEAAAARDGRLVYFGVTVWAMSSRDTQTGTVRNRSVRLTDCIQAVALMQWAARKGMMVCKGRRLEPGQSRKAPGWRWIMQQRN